MKLIFLVVTIVFLQNMLPGENQQYTFEQFEQIAINRSPYEHLRFAIIDRNREEINLYAKQIPDINTNLALENEPFLHLAARCSTIQVVQQLLDLGADPKKVYGYKKRLVDIPVYLTAVDVARTEPIRKLLAKAIIAGHVKKVGQ